MRYLITGGAGFIGCNTADYFLSRGEDVTIFDNFSRRGTIDNSMWLHAKHPSIRIVQGDVRIDHEHRMQDEVNRADVVVHLAGQVAVTTSFKNPREDFEINALGTFNVLEAVRKSPNKPIILYASTNKVYGGMEDIVIVEQGNRYAYRDFPEGIPENRFLDFHSPYGCSKGVGDQYVRDYARMYGLKTVVFRQSCVYGMRQFGIEDQGWVAWFTIATALNKPLTIYGDGKQVRDVLYMDDLARAYELAVKNIHKTAGQIYNVGGGAKFTMSLLELLNHLETFFGMKIAKNFSDWRPGDQPVYISDIRKAKEHFGWEPTVSAQEGTKRLHAWVVENKHLFRHL